MNLLIDTHALFWFFSNDERLSQKARNHIRRSLKIFIPTIVLLELFRMMDKKGLINQFNIILSELKNGTNNSIVSLDLPITEKSFKLQPSLEMHDAVVVATAQLLKVPIITKDETIQKVYPQTIW